MRLRWKKEPKETGLRAVGAGPRSSNLHDGERTYASVYPLGGNWVRPLKGWYWVVVEDELGERINTCNTPSPDEETAKKEAMDFVRAKLKSKLIAEAK